MKTVFIVIVFALYHLDFAVGIEPIESNNETTLENMTMREAYEEYIKSFTLSHIEIKEASLDDAIKILNLTIKNQIKISGMGFESFVVSKNPNVTAVGQFVYLDLKRNSIKTILDAVTEQLSVTYEVTDAGAKITFHPHEK